MSSGRTILKIAGVLAGLVVLKIGVTERSDFTRIKAHGEKATITAPEKYTVYKQKGNETYLAELSFTTQRGQLIETKHSFPKDALADFEAKRPVTIIYERDNPTNFVFEKDSAPLFLILAGIGLALISLVLV